MPLSAIKYLFFDTAIGEYDVEMYISAIDIIGFDLEYFENSKSINEMAAALDNWKIRNGF